MRTILIMDDDVRLANEWKEVLTKHHYTVLVTHGAQEALEVYDRYSIDLCVVDMFVRGGDGRPGDDGGLNFTGRVRLHPLFNEKNTPIIGVSGAPTQFGLNPRATTQGHGGYPIYAKAIHE